MGRDKLIYDIDDRYLDLVAKLPFHKSLEEWSSPEVNLITIRHGNSRHPVVFVRSGTVRFAIKETTERLAYKELHNYEKIAQSDIQTIKPIGVIIRTSGNIEVPTKVGRMYESDKTAYLITVLAESVLPQSTLYNLRLTWEAKSEIWDVIAEFFAQIHAKNIYWGDASLQNLLIKFRKVTTASFQKKRKLEVILSDAETVEVRQSLSSAMATADIDFFFESMMWFDEDLRSKGMVRDHLITERDIDYIQQIYEDKLPTYRSQVEFDRITGFHSERHFGRFSKAVYSKVLLKQLAEHKWYLSEKLKREVSLREATVDWYINIFEPIRSKLLANRFNDYFPNKTELDLYLEIMENKYFLSEKLGKDVGLNYAMTDYGKKFAVNKSFMGILKKLFQDLAALTKAYQNPIELLEK